VVTDTIDVSNPPPQIHIYHGKLIIMLPNKYLTRLIDNSSTKVDIDAEPGLKTLPTKSYGQETLITGNSVRLPGQNFDSRSLYQALLFLDLFQFFEYNHFEFTCIGERVVVNRLCR
jgi:hypothetical protein